MRAEDLTRALEEHLRAQLTLATACRDRAFAAPDPRLRSAWIGPFIRISNAMAATGSAIARLQAARGAPIPGLFALGLPDLPVLPEERGPTPFDFCENNRTRGS